MDFEKLRINEISKVNKRSGNIVCENDSYEMSTDQKNKWVGIKIKSDFQKNGIYLIRFTCETQIDGMALTLIAFQDGDEIKTKVFTLETSKKEYEFLFTPFDSDSIMFVTTSYGKYPTGKIRISDIRISSLFPMKGKDDLKEKIEILQPWYHNFVFDGMETRGKEKHTYREAKWKGILDLLPDKIEGKKILDIACNNGWYSLNLSKLGADVIGFDISYDYIIRGIFAKNVLNVNNLDFKVATVDDLDKFGKKFDVILCLGYFYHDMNPLETLKNILKKANVVIIDNVTSNLDYKDGFVKDESISRDGLVVSNDLIIKTIEEEGYKIAKTVKLGKDRLAFKIESLSN